jgi:homoserine kinase
MLESELRGARVLVPGSTSNLGAGFDTLGLALNRYVTAAYEPGPGTLAIVRTGTLTGLVAPIERDTLARAFTTRLREYGIEEVGGVLRCASEIPLARGMGSSAAAVVAARMLADAAAGAVSANDADRQAALGWAEAWEGHPDNAAPSLFGGLVGVARDAAGGAHAFPLPLAASCPRARRAPRSRPPCRIRWPRAPSAAPPRWCAASPRRIPSSSASASRTSCTCRIASR